MDARGSGGARRRCSVEEGDWSTWSSVRCFPVRGGGGAGGTGSSADKQDDEQLTHEDECITHG